MKALVLGGAGFVGVAVCKELMRRGVETVVAGRKARPYGTFTSYVQLDRDDEQALGAALDREQPDALVDLACYQARQVQAAMRLFKGRRYVFMSTGVYPPLYGKPAREEDFLPLEGDVPDGDLEYFQGKRWCETLLARSRDFPWTVVRPPAIVGAADHTLRIAAYLQRIEDGGPMLVPAEAADRQFGLAWVKDVGWVTALVSDPGRPVDGKAYNVAFEGVSIVRMIEALARPLGKRPEIVKIPYAELPPDASPYGPNPDRSAGYDLSRSRRELGFEPSALEDAVAEVLAWYTAERPSHPGYASRAQELELAAARR